jgi:methylated-DNA-protein-cysteine methyltransferase-like protein
MSVRNGQSKKSGSGSGSLPVEREPLYARIYAIVRLIPAGQVATYGQIAEVVGGCTARMVGYAMAACPADVPWQRVVNAQGKVSPRADHWGAEVQRLRLIEEGIEFDADFRIDMARVRWPGPDRAWLAEHGYPLPEDRELPPDALQPKLF